ncbi:nitroreductase/quinone reductase family protein [Schumannella soli]|uniref:Nitroreductase family deazaflavin-dependent oxidoreductase n=1 Tax=Schumannella soli TaxID=2590779 RepID=A0A506XPD6_9MICO|nr:nitroreductase/quinone reductase family protein [Schumannella soli]TPW74554.1 nitroreductase family deazaflavin-dependent oxidoreductase [Schumannella soli]
MTAHELDEQVIAGYRAGGDLGVPGVHRERIALLTTTGRRTGEKRTSPMMFVPQGAGVDGGVIVVASAAGAPRHPAWYLNLVADPRVHVELPDSEWDARAETVTGDARARLWAELLEGFPFFAEHERKAGREIPLVKLVPATR